MMADKRNRSASESGMPAILQTGGFYHSNITATSLSEATGNNILQSSRVLARHSSLVDTDSQKTRKLSDEDRHANGLNSNHLRVHGGGELLSQKFQHLQQQQQKQQQLQQQNNCSVHQTPQSVTQPLKTTTASSAETMERYRSDGMTPSDTVSETARLLENNTYDAEEEQMRLRERSSSMVVEMNRGCMDKVGKILFNNLNKKDSNINNSNNNNSSSNIFGCNNNNCSKRSNEVSVSDNTRNAEDRFPKSKWRHSDRERRRGVPGASCDVLVLALLVLSLAIGVLVLWQRVDGLETIVETMARDCQAFKQNSLSASRNSGFRDIPLKNFADDQSTSSSASREDVVTDDNGLVDGWDDGDYSLSSEDHTVGLTNGNGGKTGRKTQTTEANFDEVRPEKQRELVDEDVDDGSDDGDYYTDYDDDEEEEDDEEDEDEDDNDDYDGYDDDNGVSDYTENDNKVSRKLMQGRASSDEVAARVRRSPSEKYRFKEIEKKVLKKVLRKGAKLEIETYNATFWSLFDFNEHFKDETKIIDKWPGKPIAHRGNFIEFPKAETPLAFYTKLEEKGKKKKRKHSLLDHQEDTGIFTVQTSGIYLIHFNITIVTDDYDPRGAIGLFLNNDTLLACPVGGFKAIRSNPDETDKYRICNIDGVVELHEGNQLQILTLVDGMKIRLKRESFLRVILTHKFPKDRKKNKKRKKD